MLDEVCETSEEIMWWPQQADVAEILENVVSCVIAVLFEILKLS